MNQRTKRELEFSIKLARLSARARTEANTVLQHRPEQRQQRTWNAAITDSIYIIGGWLDPVNHRRGRVWWILALALYALVSNGFVAVSVWQPWQIARGAQWMLIGFNAAVLIGILLRLNRFFEQRFQSTT
jgi:fructose-1,6-bisphosphatase/inositol monophosphatase family enzyme